VNLLRHSGREAAGTWSGTVAVTLAEPQQSRSSAEFKFANIVEPRLKT
jgi:hypothetical protein